MQVILLGGGSACACEHMLGYINNPENSLALIFHSFIRSLSNFRSCPIRPIFPILLFWSKFKNACKYVKFAIRYQIINEEGFFSTPFTRTPGLIVLRCFQTWKKMIFVRKQIFRIEKYPQIQIFPNPIKFFLNCHFFQ